MPEPFIERLSRFTPDAGGLDRDALLFAAGHGSARPNRTWIALAAALAVSQAVSLVLLWSPAAPSAASLTAPPAAMPPPLPTPESPAPASSDDSSLWLARHSLLESDRDDRPAPSRSGTFVDGGPPLRAFATPPPSILN
jgi:hypothetical protein